MTTVELPRKDPIDMSLRMSSLHVPFKPILDQMRVNPKHLHVIGESIATVGRFAGRIAKSHYVSTANMRGKTEAEVMAWLTHVVQIVGSHPSLVDQLKTGTIEAVLWIAVFGTDPVPMPSIDPHIIKMASEIGLRIFLENYTDFDDDGVPKKSYLS